MKALLDRHAGYGRGATSAMRGTAGNGIRGQAALDFLISYGFVILVIGIAIAILLVFSTNNSYTETSFCNPSPGFSCGYYFLNTSGAFSVQIAQVSGTTATINGVACAAAPNSTGDRPAYGNTAVSSNAIFYPAVGMGSALLYSGKANTYDMYCYGPGGMSKGIYGNSYAGYVWLNYTIPGYKSQTVMIATFNTKYT